MVRIGRRRLVALASYLGTSCLLLGACGTALELGDDPSSGDAASADGSTDRDGANIDGAAGEGGPPSDASSERPPNEKYVSNFDPPQNTSPFGFETVLGGGSAGLAVGIYTSFPNGLRFGGVASAVLTRALNAKANRWTVSLKLWVEQYPQNFGISSIDLLTVACGLSPPFGRVDLEQTAQVTLADGMAVPVTGAAPLNILGWRTVTFDMTRQQGKLTMVFNGGLQPQTLDAPDCTSGPIALGVGHSYQAPQTPPATDMDAYQFVLDDVVVDVTY